MSAYICNPEHFAALAVYAVKKQAVLGVYQVLEANQTELAVLIAAELAIENIRSVAARYPQDKSGSRPGPCLTDEQIVSESQQFARQYVLNCPPLSDVDLLSMLNCYDYQACETSDYSERMASKQVELLRAHIMQPYPQMSSRDMAGYNEAIRDFHGQKSETLPITPEEEAASKAKELAGEAIERASLLAKYPKLLRLSDSKYSRYATAAKNIRIELKAAFPGVKFRVTSESFSMGNAVRIGWVDGPTSAEVEALTDKYQNGSFNGMEDIYEYAPSTFRNLFGSSKWVTCNRDYSAQFADEVIAILAFEDYQDVALPSGEDYKAGRLSNVYPVLGDPDRSWDRLIYRKMVTISKFAAQK